MIQIINWSSFQSYKDRKPPWIRLHKSILDNYEFHSMSENARSLIFMLWLLASEDEDPVSGLIRYGYGKIAFRLRMTEKKVKDGCEELEQNGFLQLNQQCNSSVTDVLQNSYESVTPETETETETERVLPDFVDEKLWDDFVLMRKKIKAPMTDKAIELAISKLEKMKGDGQSPNAVLEQSIMNSWKGLFPVEEKSTGVDCHSPTTADRKKQLGVS